MLPPTRSLTLGALIGAPTVREGLLPIAQHHTVTALGCTEKRVHDADGPVEPIMLQILGKNLRQAVVFGVCPEVRVEPAQLVGGTPAKRVTQDRLVWIENGELFQELFRFAQSVGLLEDDVAADGAGYGCNKLENRLMWQTHRVFDDASPEKLGGNLLLAGKAAVEAIDQNVGINESGHADTGPLCSNLYRGAAGASPSAGACVVVPSPDRTSGDATPDLRLPPVCRQE